MGNVRLAACIKRERGAATPCRGSSERFRSGAGADAWEQRQRKCWREAGGAWWAWRCRGERDGVRDRDRADSCGGGEGRGSRGPFAGRHGRPSALGHCSSAATCGAGFAGRERHASRYSTLSRGDLHARRGRSTGDVTHSNTSEAAPLCACVILSIGSPYYPASTSRRSLPRRPLGSRRQPRRGALPPPFRLTTTDLPRRIGLPLLAGPDRPERRRASRIAYGASQRRRDTSS